MVKVKLEVNTEIPRYLAKVQNGFSRRVENFNEIILPSYLHFKTGYMVGRNGRQMALLTLLLISGMGLLSSCHSFQPLQFRRIQNLKVSKWDFSHPVVTADVVYYNPNSFGFEFKGANVDLHLDSLWLGHTDLDTTIRVNPHSEFTVPLPIQLDLQRLLKNGLQTYLNRQVDVKVDGTVKGSKAGIPRKFPIHYEGMQQLNLNLF